MLVSPAEREELIRRVSRQVTGRNADAALVRGSVDRVIAALAAREAPTQVVVVTAESMPDLASRLRAGVAEAQALRDAAVATEGRHTVLVARVETDKVAAVRQAAERIGARCTTRDET